MSTTEAFKGIDSNDNQTGLKKSSSLDVKKLEENQSNRLRDRKINDVLNQIEKPEEVEKNYKEKLQNLDNNLLDQLSKQNISKIEEILQKSQTDIQPSIIQAQIDELEKKDIKFLNDL